ncbi:unnamed protein product [Amoebophrya sp. A25]|nr:unnamed protein product [Amoebophrya sp. A25]|eukprot:GSA25T00013975001.1
MLVRSKVLKSSSGAAVPFYYTHLSSDEQRSKKILVVPHTVSAPLRDGDDPVMVPQEVAASADGSHGQHGVVPGKETNMLEVSREIIPWKWNPKKFQQCFDSSGFLAPIGDPLEAILSPIPGSAFSSSVSSSTSSSALVHPYFVRLPNANARGVPSTFLSSPLLLSEASAGTTTGTTSSTSTSSTGGRGGARLHRGVSRRVLQRRNQCDATSFFSTNTSCNPSKYRDTGWLVTRSRRSKGQTSVFYSIIGPPAPTSEAESGTAGKEPAENMANVVARFLEDYDKKASDSLATQMKSQAEQKSTAQDPPQAIFTPNDEELCRNSVNGSSAKGQVPGSEVLFEAWSRLKRCMRKGAKAATECAGVHVKASLTGEPIPNDYSQASASPVADAGGVTEQPNKMITQQDESHPISALLDRLHMYVFERCGKHKIHPGPLAADLAGRQ